MNLLIKNLPPMNDKIGICLCNDLAEFIAHWFETQQFYIEITVLEERK